MKGVFLGRWFPWLLIGLALLAGWLPGSMIREAVPDAFQQEGRDKVLHAIGFMVLLLGFRPWGRNRVAVSEWLPGTVLLLILFALIHEGVQVLIPGRALSWEDLLADGIGIAVAASLVLLFDDSR